MFIKAQYVTLAVIIVIMFLHPWRVMSYPFREPSDYPIDPEDECRQNDTIEELCQRCAKSTKSLIVYPLCCRKKEDARHWCESYLHFGIH